MKPTDKEIIFYSYDENILNEPNNPIPTLQALPEWYRDAKRYLDNDTAKPTFKACMSFFDSMSLGYSLVTPSDILIDVSGDDVHVTIEQKYKNFIQIRPDMEDFKVPEDCYPHHIAVLPQWGIRLPEGYSALYVSPLNRFDLPFTATSGVIENDKMYTPGNVPVFLKKSFRGIIPKGTPYIQIIPFKRESWGSTIIELTKEQADEKRAVADIFRSKPTGVYKKVYWERKEYS